jgi:hypothetical protein
MQFSVVFKEKGEPLDSLELGGRDARHLGVKTARQGFSRLRRLD